MKISLINASPKADKSTSGLLLNDIKTKLLPDTRTELYSISGKDLTPESMAKIFDADAVVFALPVYMDSLPSHLLSPLLQMESYRKDNPIKNPIVYTMVNGGFYEGKNSIIAIDMMKHWCKKAGLKWGQALGSGAGDMYGSLSSLPIGVGPSANLGRALDKIADTINRLDMGENIIISPNIPRFAWKIGASILVWNKRAKANGLSKKDLYYAQTD